MSFFNNYFFVRIYWNFVEILLKFMKFSQFSLFSFSQMYFSLSLPHTEMSIYEEDECNQYYGTDQTVFPAFMNPDEGIGAFEPMICRTLVSNPKIIYISLLSPMVTHHSFFLFIQTQFSTWNTSEKRNIAVCLDCVLNWIWAHQLISRIAFVVMKTHVHQRVPSIYFAAMVCMLLLLCLILIKIQLLQHFLVSFRNTIDGNTPAFLFGRRSVGECWIGLTSRIWKTCNLVRLWNCE